MNINGVKPSIKKKKLISLWEIMLMSNDHDY